MIDRRTGIFAKKIGVKLEPFSQLHLPQCRYIQEDFVVTQQQDYIRCSKLVLLFEINKVASIKG
jgi:hypothetical protein